MCVHIDLYFDFVLPGNDYLKPKPVVNKNQTYNTADYICILL